MAEPRLSESSLLGARVRIKGSFGIKVYGTVMEVEPDGVLYVRALIGEVDNAGDLHSRVAYFNCEPSEVELLT